MYFDILDSFDDLGIGNLVQDETELQDVLNGSSKSIKFTQIIEWFSKEFQALCGLDSCVNAILDAEDFKTFLLEVSSLLKELQCPYKLLLNGPVNERLSDEKSRSILLDFLCTELQSARLVCHKTKKKNVFEIEVDESCTASSLDIAMRTLNISYEQESNDQNVVEEIVNKVQEHLSKNSDMVSKPALTDDLAQNQWDALHNLYEDFLKEYSLRRDLLLTRLDATLPSFQWGERTKGQGNKILRAFRPKREKLKKEPFVKLNDVIAARESIFFIEKTSSAEQIKSTHSSLNRIVIPDVPDRGGRPREQRPAAEMPRWAKRSHGGGGGDSRGGGRGGYRGKKQRGHKGRN